MRLEDLFHLDFGDVIDLVTEKGNDSFDYPQKATQADINAFFH